MRYLLLFICLSGVVTTRAQHLLSAKAHSQGLSVYADQGMMGLFANQAGLHTMKGFEVQTGAMRRNFADGVNEFLLGAATKLGAHTGGGLYLRNFGDDVYSETSLGLAIGRKLTERIALGVAIEGYRVGIESYGDEYQMHAQIGLQGFVTEDVILSSHAFIAATGADQQSYTSQSELNFDASVRAGKKVWLKGGVRQRIDDDFAVKFGVDYAASQSLQLNTGLLTYPLQIGAGAGLGITDHIDGHVGGFWQPDLGWSSGITLSYAP